MLCIEVVRMAMNDVLSYMIPAEFREPNWRVWSFLLIIALSIFALMSFPVKQFSGYTDPFYSPTVLVLPFVGMFRLTCYAFRKDYHRHLFKHPENCGLEMRADSNKRAYTGERGIFRIENLHRYFMYAAVLVLPFFFYDLYLSLIFNGGFVLRLGSVILLIDAVVLTIWVLSCHAVRHLTGGNVDCYSCRLAPRQRNGFFRLQSYLNSHHEALAWASLILIVFVDLYLRALSAGWQIDLTFFATH